MLYLVLYPDICRIYGGTDMRIAEARERPSSLIDRLLEIWEGSVKAAHLFLSEQGIEAIKPYVPQALRTVPHLVVAENAHGCPAAFMGAAGRTLGKGFWNMGSKPIPFGSWPLTSKTRWPGASMSAWAFRFIKEPGRMNRGTLIRFYT